MGWSPGLTEGRLTPGRLPSHQIEEDAYQEDLGFSLGHLGKSGSGRVRQTQVNEATKARISKTLQVRAGPGDGGGAWAMGAGTGVQTQATALSALPSPQRTLQKQSVVYGGKSTIRDRSSGTASSVAFTPLQVPGLWRQQARGRPCSPVLGCCFLT